MMPITRKRKSNVVVASLLLLLCPHLIARPTDAAAVAGWQGGGTRSRGYQKQSHDVGGHIAVEVEEAAPPARYSREEGPLHRKQQQRRRQRLPPADVADGFVPDLASLLTAAADARTSSRAGSTGRKLQQNSSDDDDDGNSCGICRGLPGEPYPPPLPDDDDDVLSPPPYEHFLQPDSGFGGGWTCAQLDDHASSLRNDSPACSGLKLYFAAWCCPAVSQRGLFDVPASTCEASVRSTILDTDGGSGSPYSSAIAPITTPQKSLLSLTSPYALEPINVTATLVYYHVQSISTVEGTAEMVAAIDMTWTDHRLAWDPNVHGGCWQTTARASLDAEKTDIWVPAVNLLNRASQGLGELPDEPATIYANGDVRWPRLGSLKAVCSFEGLERFPYDDLGCYFAFGSPFSSVPVNYEWSTYVTDVFPVNFHEYNLQAERVEGAVDETGIFKAQFWFSRASRYYTYHIVVPTIMFTLLSFSSFLLDVRVGERLAFGVSLLLVIIANGILTSGMLPVCAERVWITTLTLASTFWVVFALFESVIVSYLYYLDAEERNARLRQQGNDGTDRDAGSNVPSDSAHSSRRRISMAETSQERLLVIPSEEGDCQSSVAADSVHSEHSHKRLDIPLNETSGEERSCRDASSRIEEAVRLRPSRQRNEVRSLYVEQYPMPKGYLLPPCPEGSHGLVTKEEEGGRFCEQRDDQIEDSDTFQDEIQRIETDYSQGSIRVSFSQQEEIPPPPPPRPHLAVMAQETASAPPVDASSASGPVTSLKVHQPKLPQPQQAEAQLLQQPPTTEKRPAPTPPRPKLVRMASVRDLNRVAETIDTVRRLVVRGPAPSESWRIKAIRTLDLYSMFLFPISYTLFFVIMLARNPYW